MSHQRLYDSASHELSWEAGSRHCTLQEQNAELRDWHVHTLLFAMENARDLEVHGQPWRSDMSNPHDSTHESVEFLENLRAWWCHACVTIPVPQSHDHKSCSACLCKGLYITCMQWVRIMLELPNYKHNCWPSSFFSSPVKDISIKPYLAASRNGSGLA